MHEDRLVVKVEDNEFSIKRAYKEATEAKKRGVKVAFDLRGIQDGIKKRELIKYFSGL